MKALVIPTPVVTLKQIRLMKKRELGNTGIKVSEVAFGGVGIGIPYAGQPMPTELNSIRLLHEALDNGINFYDTARMYGKSEELIGKAFEGKRDQVVLNTKCVHFLDESGNVPPRKELHEKINKSLEESLKALQTDYIDVYMLHQSTLKILRNEDVIEIFTGLKKKGKVRAVGTSTYHPEETGICINKGIWDVVQVPFNLMDQRQRQFFQLADDRGVGLIIRSVLFRGMLTGRPLRFHKELVKVAEHIDGYNSMIGKNIPDLITMATKFVLSYPSVSSVLVGMDQIEHLIKALQMADGKYFAPEIMNELEEMAFPEPEFLNLHQWDKNGWLKT